MFFNKSEKIINERACKLIFVGDIGCGRTALLKTLVSGQYPHSTVATIGVEFYQKCVSLDNIQTRLDIWDISGQERFAGNIMRHCEDSDIAIIAFDLTRKQTFDGAKMWLSEINRVIDIEDLGQIILVGLKCDATPDPRLDIAQVEEFVSENNLIYMQASAKTGFNVDNLFTKALEVVSLYHPGKMQVLEEGQDQSISP
ncbi:Ras family GTPase [Legionella birminghamensis]|uniref:Ras family GTPase n=1 Tax=Legionella birminghamensis TaxID=28083 RepID=A0A378I7P5_9GAMM|nr:Rab family GTPase [Legionella birminghamensis]KTC71530.1 Ras family GTPase [Legionella birminghamensis]STX30862.1 Ras family GTPase [Legionella birminghamensis]